MNHLKIKTMNRFFWLFLSVISFAVLYTGLYLQQYDGLKPCALCIYERCALIGIVIAGIIGATAPQTPIRYIALFIWIFSAFKGIEYAWHHTMIQVLSKNYYVAECSNHISFPSWLPLAKWFPEIFKVYGNCYQQQDKILMFDISQWLIVFFTAMISFCLMFLMSQFINQRKYFY